MKFHWGHGIAIFLACFMSMILYFLFSSFNHREELVAEDYYAKEVNYQQQIDKINNASTKPIKAGFTAEGLKLTFPQEGVKGKLHFFRPSEAALDFMLDINADSNTQQVIDARKFKTGLWKLKAEWEHQGKSYYHEQSFVAP